MMSELMHDPDTGDRVPPADELPPVCADAPALLRADDQASLRAVFALAAQARAQGRHPFAARVLAADGTLLAEAINHSMPPEGDPTCHAERMAAAVAARLATPQQLRTATLYTNAEPCAMCAGAIYWCGIGRVVYGLSETALLGFTGNHPENPTLSLPCRQVFAAGQRPTEVVGPCLQDEAAVAQRGFWQGGAHAG